MINKKNVIHWGTFKYFLEQVTKNSFACKRFCLEKKMCSPVPKQSLWLLVTSFDPIRRPLKQGKF